jgi:hypothetical protein
MFRLVEFEINHLKPLLDEEINQDKEHWRANEYAYPKMLAENPHVFPITVAVNDHVAMCVFLVEYWKGRAHAVCILSDNIKKNPVAAYRGLKQAMELQPFDRVEFDVPIDMEIAHRRAKFLGCQQEIACAKKYLPGGIDASVYAWVRE